MVSLLTVHTWVWDATSSLPGQGSVALDGTSDCGGYWKRCVLNCGERRAAGRSVAGVGRDGLRELLTAHADADLLGSLHVDRDGRIAGRPTQGERSDSNDRCRRLGTGGVVGWRVILWFWGTKVWILHWNWEGERKINHMLVPESLQSS